MTEKFKSQDTGQLKSASKQVVDVQEVIFMLRRIENDIDKERNLEQLAQLIMGEIIAAKDVAYIIHKDMIKKEELLQSVATACYQQGMTELMTTSGE
ncbi:hypothetical protein [Pelosinus sp. sgz500959]|uniref:hypothetical protein n=1 Tax=Pelosinus sp. sgz500959 TaxID=3242472 RepID=UPI00366BE098